jgi:hypothetical protein
MRIAIGQPFRAIASAGGNTAAASTNGHMRSASSTFASLRAVATYTNEPRAPTECLVACYSTAVLRRELSATLDHNCNLQTRGMECSPGKSRFVHHDVRVAPKYRPSSARGCWISRGLRAWTPFCGLGDHKLHTKHVWMPSHRLRRTTPNLPTNRRQL